jgi:O-methyltransferase
VEQVIADGVPGDLIETGVWRGGAAIFMRALLKTHADKERIVWVADSFQGLPKPDPARYPADAGDIHHEALSLAVPVEVVRDNFAKYGLLDDRVRFLVGWFEDTLPAAPISRLAVLRLDGDMYQSTMESLTNLYPKVSRGGFVIVDDYGNDRLPCHQAVDDFRRRHAITDAIQQVDWTGVYWRRTK